MTDPTVVSHPSEQVETESETSDTEVPDFSQFIDDEQEDVDLGAILVNALETPEGDTVCSALVGIRDQITIHNKILVKILKSLGDLKK
jgi:hypothetical protein